MANCYVKAYYDWIEQTSALSDAERGRLFIGVLEYARSGLEPNLSGRESILFPAFRAQIDRDNKVSEVRAAAGKTGGEKSVQAKSSKVKQNQAKSSKVKQNSYKEEDKEEYKEEYKDKDKEFVPPKPPKGRFTPPTAEEVKAYCRERGNSVDPERFVDFYSSKGWKVGNQPMKDWKAAVRTWEKSEDKRTARNSTPTHYGGYDPDELFGD